MIGLDSGDIQEMFCLDTVYLRWVRRRFAVRVV